jgi:hypothetical protein
MKHIFITTPYPKLLSLTFQLGKLVTTMYILENFLHIQAASWVSEIITIFSFLYPPQPKKERSHYICRRMGGPLSQYKYCAVDENLAHKVFFFSTASRPALAPTQSLIQRVRWGWGAVLGEQFPWE